MNISVNIPLILFSIFLAIYSIGASFISYHLYKFGIGSSPKIVLIIFLGGSVLLGAFLIFTYNRVPWDNFSFDINQIFNLQI